MSNPSYEDQFKENLCELAAFSYDLLSYCKSRGVPAEPAMMKLAEEFLKMSNATALINNYIKYSQQHWDLIKRKDENFFIENCSDIFKDLPVSQSVKDSFKNLFLLKDSTGNHLISADDREGVWEFFHSLTKLSIKYIHQGRGPFLKQVDGKLVPKYRKEFLRDVSLERHARNWEIKLEFKE